MRLVARAQAAPVGAARRKQWSRALPRGDAACAHAACARPAPTHAKHPSAARTATGAPQGRLLEACATLIADAYCMGARLEQWDDARDGPMAHVPLGTAQQRWATRAASSRGAATRWRAAIEWAAPGPPDPWGWLPAVLGLP